MVMVRDMRWRVVRGSVVSHYVWKSEIVKVRKRRGGMIRMLTAYGWKDAPSPDITVDNQG